MYTIVNLLSISSVIKDIGEKLNSFSKQYLSSPFMSVVIAVVLVAFGFMAISYFNKR